jgi:hypothetical protein
MSKALMEISSHHDLPETIAFPVVKTAWMNVVQTEAHSSVFFEVLTHPYHTYNCLVYLKSFISSPNSIA